MGCLLGLPEGPDPQARLELQRSLISETWAQLEGPTPVLTTAQPEQNGTGRQGAAPFPPLVAGRGRGVDR